MATGLYPLLEAVAEHHKKILDLYDDYLANEGNVPAQTELSYRLSWELERHAFAEALVVHPLFEKYLPDEGKKIVEEDRAEHRAIRDDLIRLQNFQSGSQGHAAVLQEIFDRFKPHALQSEEREDLPSLEAKLSRPVSQNAADNFNKTVGAKVPIDTVADLLASPVDKLKDVFSKVLSEEERGTAVGRN